MGCFWFFVARIEGFTYDSWVVKRGLLDKSKGEQYLTSIYWAFTTAATVGYGDIAAYTKLEMVIAIFSLIAGVGFYSFTIGSMTSVLSEVNTKATVLQSKIAAIMELARETGISNQSKKSIMKSVIYNSKVIGSLWSEKTSIFHQLPQSLQLEVATTMYGGIAKRLHFFKNKNADFVVFVMPLLRPLQHTNGDYIYKENNFATEMFIIIKGRVSFVLTASEIEYKSFLKGSYFGEVEILLESYRKSNAQSCGITDLMTVSKQDLLNIVEEFPATGRDLKKIAREKATRTLRAKAEMTEVFRLKAQHGSLKSLSGKRFNDEFLKKPEIPHVLEEVQTQLSSEILRTVRVVSDLQVKLDTIEEKIEQLGEFHKTLSLPYSSYAD
jgi:hyperpolarization activated cyclic nucleotide-gated potassium channel 1